MTPRGPEVFHRCVLNLLPSAPGGQQQVRGTLFRLWMFELFNRIHVNVTVVKVSVELSPVSHVVEGQPCLLTATVQTVHSEDVIGTHLCGPANGDIWIRSGKDGWLLVPGEGKSVGQKHPKLSNLVPL